MAVVNLSQMITALSCSHALMSMPGVLNAEAVSYIDISEDAIVEILARETLPDLEAADIAVAMVSAFGTPCPCARVYSLAHFIYHMLAASKLDS